MVQSILVVISLICGFISSAFASDFEITVNSGRFFAKDELRNAKKTYEKFSGNHANNNTTTNSKGLSAVNLSSDTQNAPISTEQVRLLHSIDISQPVYTNDHFKLFWQLGIGYSHSRYQFPEGISIFTDPITLRIRDWHRTVGLGVNGTLIKNSFFMLEGDLSKFLHFQDSKIAIDSALLRVRNAESYSEVVTRLGLTASMPNTHVKFRLHLDQGDTSDTSGLLAIEYRIDL